MTSQSITAALLLTLVASSASAHTVAVCQDRGPGSTKQAAPTVATFLAHMAKSIGAEAGSLDGAYHVSRARCDAYAKENAAVFAVLDTDSLLAHADDWSVEPVAHLGSGDDKVWHVLVREGSYGKVSDLAGKSIQSTAPGGARFVSRLVLAGALGPEALALKGTAKPLKALRKLARGQAEAAIVDQEAVAALSELGLPTKLVVLAKSEPLPGLTMATIKAGASVAPPALAKGLRGALPKLCQGDGHKLCKTLGVREFKPVSTSWWSALKKRYGR